MCTYATDAAARCSGGCTRWTSRRTPMDSGAEKKPSPKAPVPCPSRPVAKWRHCFDSSLPSMPPRDCPRRICPRMKSTPRRKNPMSKKMLALYGLKYNPFCQEVPVSALFVSSEVERFCWRIENQLGEGGFALVTGVPGSGKSATLRILAERLGNLCDVTVGVLTRPHACVADFYRELGELFGVALTPHNRWAGAKVLRQRWIAHMESSLYR